MNRCLDEMDGCLDGLDEQMAGWLDIQYHSWMNGQV